MATKSALDLLGIDALDGQVHGSTGDAAKDTSKAQYRGASSEEVDRVSGEYTDQSSPASDQRRGGRDGSSSTTTPPHTEDADTVHDGYGGRGAGKKDVSGDWDDGRTV